MLRKHSLGICMPLHSPYCIAFVRSIYRITNQLPHRVHFDPNKRLGGAASEGQLVPQEGRGSHQSFPSETRMVQETGEAQRSGSRGECAVKNDNPAQSNETTTSEVEIVDIISMTRDQGRACIFSALACLNWAHTYSGNMKHNQTNSDFLIRPSRKLSW
mmetsp:Transcript_16871/g.32324  ORF Transcript_16871/g.32324 Transcript_16871/m.32324 type:complete len:159 (+) Transcript_16871:733-1209(+)